MAWSGEREIEEKLSVVVSRFCFLQALLDDTDILKGAASEEKAGNLALLRSTLGAIRSRSARRMAAAIRDSGLTLAWDRTQLPGQLLARLADRSVIGLRKLRLDARKYCCKPAIVPRFACLGRSTHDFPYIADGEELPHRRIHPHFLSWAINVDGSLGIVIHGVGHYERRDPGTGVELIAPSGASSQMEGSALSRIGSAGRIQVKWSAKAWLSEASLESRPARVVRGGSEDPAAHVAVESHSNTIVIYDRVAGCALCSFNGDRLVDDLIEIPGQRTNDIAFAAVFEDGSFAAFDMLTDE